MLAATPEVAASIRCEADGLDDGHRRTDEKTGDQQQNGRYRQQSHEHLPLLHTISASLGRSPIQRYFPAGIVWDQNIGKSGPVGCDPAHKAVQEQVPDAGAGFAAWLSQDIEVSRTRIDGAAGVTSPTSAARDFPILRSVQCSTEREARHFVGPALTMREGSQVNSGRFHG